MQSQVHDAAPFRFKRISVPGEDEMDLGAALSDATDLSGIIREQCCSTVRSNGLSASNVMVLATCLTKRRDRYETLIRRWNCKSLVRLIQQGLELSSSKHHETGLLLLSIDGQVEKFSIAGTRYKCCSSDESFGLVTDCHNCLL
jgi:hypothetical protein